MTNMEPNKGEIVMYQPDETIRLEVRVENETVWLTQQQITDLFQRDRTVINRHINNVFKEGECDKESNVHFLHIPNSDKPVMYYSLDVIISVGYRVKSLNGTKFRRWANSILKQYLLNGYAVNKRIFDIEQKMAEQGVEIAHLKDKVNFFVRSSLRASFTTDRYSMPTPRSSASSSKPNAQSFSSTTISAQTPSRCSVIAVPASPPPSTPASSPHSSCSTCNATTSNIPLSPSTSASAITTVS